MYVGTIPRRRGLGQATGAQQTAATAGQIGSLATTGTTATLAATATGTGATILGLAPAVAIPIIGAALAGITFAVTKLIANSGCGPSCIRSTAYANQAADLMNKNLAAYLALPAPRAQTAQAAALQNFDALWAQLVNLCQNDPELAGTTAGRNCIADRQQGACKWRASPGGWQQNSNGTWTYKGWGPAGSGSDCWNWFIGLRDPIAQDPAVGPDPLPLPAMQSPGVQSGLFPGSAAAPGGAPASGLSPLLIAALVLGGVYVVGEVFKGGL